MNRSSELSKSGVILSPLKTLKFIVLYVHTV